jgi:hypothetical protein
MCQLQSIQEISQKNTWLNDRQQYCIRKIRYFKKFILLRLTRPYTYDRSRPFNWESIQTGETIRVLSKNEIMLTLDQSGKTEGCTFQAEMFNYCEKELNVFKKVDFFYDEVKQKMCKCKNIYLLQGACCSGVTAYLRPCDRSCFFFWHRSWFNKVK